MNHMRWNLKRPLQPSSLFPLFSLLNRNRMYILCVISVRHLNIYNRPKDIAFGKCSPKANSNGMLCNGLGDIDK